jgi:hypothetical protein
VEQFKNGLTAYYAPIYIGVQMTTLHASICGAVSTMLLSLDVLVKVKRQAEEEKERENNPQLQEQRMQLAWGNKHHAPTDILAGCDGDYLLMPFKCNTRGKIRSLRALRILFSWHVSEE